MALDHCYQKVFGLMIILSMMNAYLVESAPVTNECFNYCSSGGVCLRSKIGPKCICLPKWTGERCDIPQNVTIIDQIDALRDNITDLRNNLCLFVPPDYCEHDGICYVETINNMYACYCRYPYMGDTCNDISDCNNYCENSGYCSTATGSPVCTCMPGWTGIRCERLLTTTTLTAIPTAGTPSLPCVSVGLTYCNSGTCIIANNQVQCQCPPTQTGRRCETLITATSSGPIITVTLPTSVLPTSVLPPVTSQLTSCDQQPCQNGTPCYRNGNSYVCYCGSRYFGKNCENRVY